MASSTELVEILFSAIETHNQLHPDNPLAKERATRLFGGDDGVDSIALIAILMDVEEALQRRFNLRITLADEKAFSGRNSPFKDVSSLIAFVEGHIAERSSHAAPE